MDLPQSYWRHASGWLLTAGLLLGAADIAAAGRDDKEFTGAVEADKICMLNNFVIKLQDAVPYVYQGRTYYFCCAGCIRRFAVDPKKFSQAQDPVSRQKVDKAKALLYAYKDTVYYFASAQSLKEFRLDPESFLRPADEEKKPGKDEQAGDADGVAGVVDATGARVPVQVR